MAAAYPQNRRLYIDAVVVAAAQRHSADPERYPPVIELEGKWSRKKETTPAQWRAALPHLLEAKTDKCENPFLYLCLGSLGMFTDNENQAAGVVNSAPGVVVGFLTATGETPELRPVVRQIRGVQVPVYKPVQPVHWLLIRLTDGPALQRKRTFPLAGLPDDVWPLAAKSAPIKKKGYAGNYKQFNFLLSDSLTIHKLQGATIRGALRVHSLTEASLGNNHTMSLQHIYVVLTRCTKLTDLYLHFPPTLEEMQSWRWEPALKTEVERLRRLSAALMAELPKFSANVNI